MAYTGKKPVDVIDVTESQSLTVTEDLTVDTDTLFVDSANNRVGIGTTSPDRLLTLQGDNSYMWIKDAGGGNTAFIGSDGTNDGWLRLYDSSHTIKVEIESDGVTYFNGGNFGIGTQSPSAPLGVNGRITLGNQASSGTAGAGSMIVGNSAFYIQASENQNSLTKAPIIFSNIGGSSESMRIDSSGNVGIGTSSPNTLLDIEDTTPTLRLTDERNINWSGNEELGKVEFYSNDSSGIGGHVTGFIKNIQSLTGGSAQVSGDLIFGTAAYNTAATERCRIDSSGNLLIANTTNNINNGGIMLRTTGDTYYGITSTANTLHVYDNTNSVYRFYVNGNGGIRNYSANNVNLSDQREKKNITDAASTWTDIKNFSIKEFHYNSEDDADPKKIGVIAQDVQASNANLVSTFNVDDNTQRLAVKEQQITWMAIKALQEAITKIEALETKVAALEAN